MKIIKTIFILMLLVISASMVLASDYSAKDYTISLLSDQPSVTFKIKSSDYGQEKFSLNIGESKTVFGNSFELIDKSDNEYEFRYVGNDKTLAVGEEISVTEKSQEEEYKDCEVTLLDLNNNQAKVSVNGYILSLNEGESIQHDCLITLLFSNEDEAKVQLNGNIYSLKKGETVNSNHNTVPSEDKCEVTLVHQETNKVKLSVNGEMIDLEEGQTKKTSDGCKVTLTFLNENEVRAQVNGKMIDLKNNPQQEKIYEIPENDFKQKFILIIGDENSKSVVNEINLLAKIEQSNDFMGVISAYEFSKVEKFLRAKAFSGELDGKVLLVSYSTKIDAFVFGNYDSSLINDAEEFASENKLEFNLIKDDYSQLGTGIGDSEKYDANENINEDQNKNQNKDNNVNSDEQDSVTPINNDAVCNGCLKEDNCLPVGTRVANGESKYCDYTQELKLQKVDDASCQNNYECVSNQCLNAKCVSLEKQVEETKGIIQSFINWVKGIFS